MLKEYLITLIGREEKRTIRLSYRNGKLAGFLIPESEDFTDTHLVWLLNWLRSQVFENQLYDNAHDATNMVKFTVREVEQDLSFENFWNTYGYKVGNIPRTRKLWNALSDDEKIACFVGIRQYKYWLSLNSNTDHMFASTFLQQRRWENEYKI